MYCNDFILSSSSCLRSRILEKSHRDSTLDKDTRRQVRLCMDSNTSSFVKLRIAAKLSILTEEPVSAASEPSNVQS
ncbi:hypothetical protein D3C75_1208550 [compost metagenome]